ncbi:MAG: CPBP family intramembrane metalloprotease [Candidatus Heimdallarchaeota archaeon]|nr:CPBP family intramembrane metalloprotease [Candidatus Heimdallarchaeota archaeon]
MTDYLFRIIMISYIAVLGIFLYFFAQSPAELDKTDNPRQALTIIFLLFVCQFLYFALSIWVLTPIFENLGIDYYYISTIFSTIFFLILPIIILTSKSHDNFSLKEIGFSVRHLNKNQIYVILIAFAGYFVYGILRVLLLAPSESFWWVIIVLMLYSNAFVEEVFGRGFIQLKLERVYGINRALILQTLLFVLIHIPSNLYRYIQYPDLLNLIINFLFQAIHGVVYGLLYWKTRSIYPSVIVHYLTNWMGPIYFLIVNS